MSNPAAYRLLGCNDDTDTCDFCGKTNLHRVLALQPLDADGTPDGDAIYAGTTCGARALSHTLGRRISPVRMVFADNAVGRLIAEAKAWASDFADITNSRYIVANHIALMNANSHDANAAIAAGNRQAAEVRAEARKLLAARTGADLLGTRFEALLPKL